MLIYLNNSKSIIATDDATGSLVILASHVQLSADAFYGWSAIYQWIPSGLTKARDLYGTAHGPGSLKIFWNI